MGTDGLVSLFEDVVSMFDLERVDDPVFWASELFKREEIYLSERNKRYPFRRPQGSMRKKASVRMGAHGERYAIAYGGWNQQMHPLFDPRDPPAVIAEMSTLADPKQGTRVVRYERLSVVTNRALYSSSEYSQNRVAFAYGFDGSSARFRMDSIVDQLEWDLLEDDIAVPHVFALPYLPDEPAESRPEKAFDLRAEQRVRRPSR